MIIFQVALIFLNLAQAQSCFNPEKNKIIAAYLMPNQIGVTRLTPKGDDRTIPQENKALNEDNEVIKKIHREIRAASLRHGIDPRLIYGLMIAQSGANPFSSVNEGKEGEDREVYGLFGFRKSEAKEVKEKCEKAKSPRLCQVEYYANVILKTQQDGIGDTCPKSKWDDLSQTEKFAVLDQDSCKAIPLAKRDCLSSRQFQNSGACELISQVIDWSKEWDRRPLIPLCSEYINMPAESSPAVPQLSPKKKVTEP